MTYLTRLEDQVAALIGAYADRAPTDMDPIATTRMAAGPRYGDPPRLPFRSVGLWLGFAVVVMALLITIVAGALAAGGQLLRRDPVSVIADPVSVIAQYGKIHRGYVFVYSDGRVVRNTDTGSILERHLTPEGLDLIRSGAVEVRTSLAYLLPESAWADPEFTAYEPPGYAVCSWGEPIDASGILSRLPVSAQALLHGKERTYDNTDAGLGAAPPSACFEVTAEDAYVLVGLLANVGFEADWWGPRPNFLGAGSDGGSMSKPARSGSAPAEVRDPVDAVLLTFWPILPHGTWVFWGG